MHLLFGQIIDSLATHGYAVCDDFLPDNLVKDLAKIALKRQQNGEMVAAKTGKTIKNLNANIRGDHTLWLEENDAEAPIQAYFSHMNALRNALNASLFLGLQSFETHFAIYPIGGAYQKHLDQFASTENARQISSILYLNNDWQADNGGELRLDLGERSLDILPCGGKLVLFQSAKFWHEVLPAKRPRISLTGWFRRRENFI